MKNIKFKKLIVLAALMALHGTVSVSAMEDGSGNINNETTDKEKIEKTKEIKSAFESFREKYFKLIDMNEDNIKSKQYVNDIINLYKNIKKYINKNEDVLNIYSIFEEKAIETFNSLKESINSLKESIEKDKNKVKELLEKEYNDFKDKYNGFENKISKHKLAINNLNSKEDIINFKEDLEKLKFKILCSKENEFKDVSENEKTKLNQLTNDIKNLEKNADDKLAKLAKIKNENKIKEKEYNDFENELSKHKLAINNLNSKKKIIKFKEDLENLKFKIEEFIKTKFKGISENEKTKLNQLTNDIKSLEKNADDKLAKLAKIKNENKINIDNKNEININNKNEIVYEEKKKEEKNEKIITSNKYQNKITEKEANDKLEQFKKELEKYNSPYSYEIMKHIETLYSSIKNLYRNI